MRWHPFKWSIPDGETARTSRRGSDDYHRLITVGWRAFECADRSKFDHEGFRRYEQERDEFMRSGRYRTEGPSLLCGWAGQCGEIVRSWK